MLQWCTLFPALDFPFVKITLYFTGGNISTVNSDTIIVHSFNEYLIISLWCASPSARESLLEKVRKLMFKKPTEKCWYGDMQKEA